ncbi:uncharacterized protein LOC116201766 [Punica granatum]|uniref:Uncharacterized protein n=2 Tax=Punica granatum TaxID=22663 RepID=A0A218XZR2_PUNGR|nr:uncharacterized protein LOC116201766 [Punica granatum]OWM89772.1 hypothetical protein CDL15_Pgr024520 [Punica granatum]PKI42282.1 hypothetical protein CRG98_037333 [Punica granatum]
MESLSDRNLDLINVAIHRLMEERKSGHDKDPSLGPESDDDHLLLSKLLSQVETLKGESAAIPADEPSPETKDASSRASILGMNTEDSGGKPKGTREVETDEIVKELKQVKRQNTITHWLLSIMIVLTLTWQVSEVSLVLKLKDGISHPFRSVGSMLTGMFKGSRANGRNGDDSSMLTGMFKGGPENGRNGDDSPGSNQSQILPIPAMIPVGASQV